MHILDPLRPKYQNGLPMLLWNSVPVTIVPSLLINLLPSGQVNITANVCYRFGTARYYGQNIDHFSVADWLDKWFNGPEEILIPLGWHWESAPLPKEKSGGLIITLDELLAE